MRANHPDCREPMTKRTLVLERETLFELTRYELARVVGAGAVPTLDADCDATTLCLTQTDKITCYVCL
jgi:hypothetical protein